MNLKLFSLVGLVALATGCAEIRASSRQQLSAKDSHVVIASEEADVVRRLAEMFSKRGFQLTDRSKHKLGMVYTFKGTRSSVTTVAGNQYGVSSSTNVVGSIFYARLEPVDGNTQVELLGKPTLDGKPVCSDQEQPWMPGCDTIVTGAFWSGRDQMTGRDEAEMIRSIMLELELGTSGAPGSVVVKAPEPEAGKTVEPTCVAEEQPEWKTASAVEKRELMRKCAQPKAPAQASDATP